MLMADDDNDDDHHHYYYYYFDGNTNAFIMLVLVRRWRFAMLVKMGRRHCNGSDGVPSALCEFALM